MSSYLTPKTQSPSNANGLVLYSANLTDPRYLSWSDLLSALQDQFRDPTPVVQREIPGEGSTISVVGGSSTWVLTRPTGALTNVTLLLPASTAVTDGQEITMTSTETISSLSVNGNGITVNGAPTSIGVDSPFKLKYNKETNEWYRFTS